LKETIRMTDERFGNVSTEAASSGLLAPVQDGDIIDLFHP
jgi:dihydroxyacid dehydratase/phosphogluconate dehydratase